MNFGPAVLRRRVPIILASLAVLAVCAVGVGRLQVSVDPHNYFAKDDPDLLRLSAFERTYTKEFNVLFVLRPKSGDAFSPKALRAVRWLTDRGWEIPLSSRVDSLANYQYTRAEGDELIVEDLVGDPEAMTESGLREVRARALSEPPLVGRLVSPSGHVSAVNVNIVKKEETLDEELRAIAAVRELAAEFKVKFPEIDLLLSGFLMWNDAFRGVAQAEMASLVPLMVLVMMVVIALSLRSWAASLATMLVILASALTAMGLGGWLGIPLGDATSAAPSIVMTLAVADSIHILTTMFQQMRDGRTQSEAIAESLRVNLQPVFLTSVTTAVGFLSMNFSDAPPFHDLGNLVAAGVMAAFVYSILLMPAVVSLVPMKPRAAASGRPGIERFAEFVLRRPRRIFWGMALTIAVLTTGIFRIEFDDNFVEYMSESVPFRRDTDYIQKNLMGLDALEYDLDAGGPGGVHEPAYQKKVEEFARWFRSRPKVSHVDAMTDITKKLNKTMHGDDPLWYRIPENRELAAQYLLLYEMSVPFGLDLTTRINLDKSASRFTVVVKNMTSVEMAELARDARRWLAGNAPPGFRNGATGLSILFSRITENNIRSMLGGTLFALVLISGLLVGALGSLRLGLLSLVPNLVPALMTFGLWGLAMKRVGLAVSVVAAMTLGIVVDDTIHFLSKYRRARRELGLGPEDAVRYSFRNVGAAMFFTSMILIGGFLVLSVSSFRINMVMGALSAVAIAFALAADFLFLPPLLLKMEETTHEWTRDGRGRDPGRGDPAGGAAEPGGGFERAGAR